jgi:hypothetical protein
MRSGMKIRLLQGLACGLAVCLAGSAAAASPADDPGPAPEDIETHILQEQQELERRWIGLAKVRLSVPQRVSGSVGLIGSRQPAGFDCSTVCKHRGPLLQIEPGVAGGQLSAGYAVVMGELGDNDRFLSKVCVAWGLKAALMRTWGDASLSPSEQTLLGVEGDFTVIGINFSLGLFRSIEPSDIDDPWLVGGGLGWGF